MSVKVVCKLWSKEDWNLQDDLAEIAGCESLLEDLSGLPLLGGPVQGDLPDQQVHDQAGHLLHPKEQFSSS